MKLVEEVARVLVSSKYKEASTTNVSVTDYIPADCGEIREEANVKMTAEQVAQLGKAVAAGDIGAAVVIGGSRGFRGSIVGIGEAGFYRHL